MLSIIAKILKSTYIHREIREKGGAYGGYASYNTEDGIFSFTSYRDPHILSTLKVFDQARRHIKTVPLNEEEIKEAVIQICSEIDKPDAPGQASRKAFYRKLLSLSDDMREQYKARLLSATQDMVREAADRYFDDLERRTGVAVISNEEKLREANVQGGGFDLFRI
jgi:Zn-dependent M16 (insulinase) family peptidase